MRTLPKSLIDDNIYCVNYLVYLDSKDAKRYLYLAVRRSNMQKFQEALREGRFDADDYGIVLEYGEGEASAITKEKMKIMYKCNSEIPLQISAESQEAV